MVFPFSKNGFIEMPWDVQGLDLFIDLHFSTTLSLTCVEVLGLHAVFCLVVDLTTWRPCTGFKSLGYSNFFYAAHVINVGQSAAQKMMNRKNTIQNPRKHIITTTAS